MALILNGNANPKVVMYNGNSLRSVVYNGVVVWFTPNIYTGGSGSELFGTKSFCRDISGSGTYYASSRASFDASRMYAWLKFDNSLSTYRYGSVFIVSNMAFDISQYSTMTVTYTIHPNATYPTKYYPGIQIGMSTSCENSNYSLSGTHYISSWKYTASGTTSITLDLTNAKAHGSLYYPYIYGYIGHDASYTADIGFTVNSIVLS